MASVETTHFVYPYIIPRDPTFGWELLFSIRSLEKFFKDPFDVTIIGEKPTWLDDSNFGLRVEILINSDVEKYPRVQNRTNEKYMRATEMYKDFVIIHDDMILLKDTYRKDIITPRRFPEELNFNLPGYDKKLSRHMNQIKYTYFELKSKGKKAEYNFACHVPMYMESTKLKLLDKEFTLVKKGTSGKDNKEYALIIENLYYNYFNIPGKNLFSDDYWYGIYGTKSELPPKEVINRFRWLNWDDSGFYKNSYIIPLLSQHLN
jgi:hypothetical protein